MADQTAIHAELVKRRRDAYGQVVGVPGWQFVLLDLLAYCDQTPDSTRSAGRYDIVARLIKRAEGPITLPEVKTNG